MCRLNMSLLIIALLTISQATSRVASTPASSPETSRILVVRDEAFQKAIEEAASLSVDMPTESNGSNGSSSYQHVSLASLTLAQRSSLAGGQQLRFNTRRQANSSEENWAHTQAQQADSAGKAAASGQEAWRELQLARVKPSWLNVSRRFKLTGESIQEMQYMMPAEFTLRAAFDSPVLLKTKLGILEGVRSIKFNKHLYTFLGVPYAKAPVEELRFKLPVPVERWEGILQATKWPPFCVQPSMTLASKSSPVHVLSQMMSEDCLYLNVWTPSLKYNKAHKRPVMVWIHGGAFQFGGVSVDENDGSALALLGDVVVVTFNYRVSAFGFLNANNPSQAPNNVGLFDQRLAMEWVQANIRQFGGDPQQVTLFGESAGGHSVGLHLVSPASHPLFRRAILQSGVPTSYLRSYDVNTDNPGSPTAEAVSSVMMAKRLKCYLQEGPDRAPAGNETEEAAEEAAAEAQEGSEPLLSDQSIECMRNKSSLDILKALGAPGSAGFFPTGNDLKGFFPNGPIMDSFDPDNLKIGPQKDFLIGTNTDEGTFMLHYGMPKVFPAKSAPTVSNIEQLKSAMSSEIERMAKAAKAANATSEVDSATGQNGGAQAHLYKPLLRTSSSLLQSFMPKSPVGVLPNGTILGNATEFSREAEFGRQVGSLVTDIIFLCPARSLARTLSEAGRNVYFYLYTHRSSRSPYHQWMGVSHHCEVEFTFGRPLRLADVYSGRDIEMSQRMIKMWSHFAYTGSMLEQSNVSWPKYGVEEANYMALAADSAQLGQRYHDRVCNIYETVISVHLHDT